MVYGEVIQHRVAVISPEAIVIGLGDVVNVKVIVSRHAVALDNLGKIAEKCLSAHAHYRSYMLVGHNTHKPFIGYDRHSHSGNSLVGGIGYRLSTAKIILAVRRAFDNVPHGCAWVLCSRIVPFLGKHAFVRIDIVGVIHELVPVDENVYVAHLRGSLNILHMDILGIEIIILGLFRGALFKEAFQLAAACKHTHYAVSGLHHIHGAVTNAVGAADSAAQCLILDYGTHIHQQHYAGCKKGKYNDEKHHYHLISYGKAFSTVFDDIFLLLPHM